MRQPAKGHSKFGDQLQNMHINQVCSDIDHLAAGPEKQNTLKKKKRKQICNLRSYYVVCGVWCAVLWCGVGHSTRRRVSSILETCIRLGLFQRARSGQISIRFISKCLITCRLSLNKHTPPSLSSLSLSPSSLLLSLSVLSVCK